MAHKARSITLENVEAILHFLPIFDDAKFQAGELVMKQGQLPYWDYDNSIIKFIKALYDNGWIVDFDWTEWQQEAKQYWSNPETIKEADIDTIQKLLTTHVRKDRFCDGHMAEAIENGHIDAILKRLNNLSTSLT